MKDRVRRITGTPRRAVVAIGAVIVGLMAIVGAAPVKGQEDGHGEWAAAHCSAEAVRSRHSRVDDATYRLLPLPDETTLQGLFALASLERECLAAAVAAAEAAINPPGVMNNGPWTAFCSRDAVRRRHPNADRTLLWHLPSECRGSLQAASDAEHELRRCRYSSVSQCGPDEGCAVRLSAPVPDERWLEVPSLDGVSIRGFLASTNQGPWPLVRRCDTRGCSRIEVHVSRSDDYLTLHQRDGPWFVKFDTDSLSSGRDAGGFVEVATLGLATLVYFGSCPQALAADR